MFCVLYRKYFVKNFFVSGKKVVLKFGSWQDVFYFCPRFREVVDGVFEGGG